MQARICLLQKTVKEENDAIKKELQVYISTEIQSELLNMLCMVFCSFMRCSLMVFSVVNLSSVYYG